MKTALPVMLAGLLACGASHAQTPVQKTPPAAAAPAATPASAPTLVKPDQVDVAVEHRIADLRTRFKITPSEEHVFSDFAQVMRENAHRIADLVAKRNAAAKDGNAVDQLRTYADMQRVYTEDLQRTLPAFSTLYDALTPDQKKRADQSFRELAGIRT